MKRSIFDPKSDYYPFPKDLPKSLIFLLIAACLFIGLAALRHGTGLQGWIEVMLNWTFMLFIIPTATAVIALPLKYRDNDFELKLAYYLGMFVAFLFTLAKLRYWRG